MEKNIRYQIFILLLIFSSIRNINSFKVICTNNQTVLECLDLIQLENKEADIQYSITDPVNSDIDSSHFAGLANKKWLTGLKLVITNSQAIVPSEIAEAISPLFDLRSLELGIINAVITDLTPITNAFNILTKLSELTLNLSQNQITDISSLSVMFTFVQKLTYLNLNFSSQNDIVNSVRLSDISVLGTIIPTNLNLTHLYLDFSINNIQNLSGLEQIAQLTKLTKLDLVLYSSSGGDSNNPANLTFIQQGIINLIIQLEIVSIRTSQCNIKLLNMSADLVQNKMFYTFSSNRACTRIQGNNDYCVSPLEFDGSCSACRPGFSAVPDCNVIINDSGNGNNTDGEDGEGDEDPYNGYNPYIQKGDDVIGVKKENQIIKFQILILIFNIMYLV